MNKSPFLSKLGKIHILDQITVNRIAAGEVIENPAGIIRELLDNAVDSGAHNIEVRINFSDFFIEVLDDGCGIHPSDLPLAFEKHATSKIKHFEDIYFTPTLGFRGEALSSLASVSEVKVETSVGDDGEGVSYHIRGEKKGNITKISCNRGTRIRVKDLFFNTPVRKKFLSLKDPAHKTLNLKPGEKRNIKQEIIRHILAQKGISFRYFSIDSMKDDPIKEKLEINVPSHYTLKDKILLFFKSNAYGESLEDSLLSVKENLNEFQVQGYITNLTIREYRSDKQFLIIKNRVVRDPGFLRAVVTAYIHKIPRGSHPMIFLRVDTKNSDFVDANVHPRKEQVKFQNPQLFFDTILTTIKHTLQKSLSENTSPVNYSTFPPQPHPHPSNSSDVLNTLADGLTQVRDPFQHPAQEYPFFAITSQKQERKKLFQFNPKNSNNKEWTSPPLTIMGQIAQTFIIFAIGDDLFIADQHAAHERINYDHLLASLSSSAKGDVKKDSQMLLVPMLIEKDSMEKDSILLQQELLDHLGFEIENFGSTTLKVNRVPAYLPENKIEKAVKSLFKMIAQRSPQQPLKPRSVEAQEFIGDIIANLACRMSIKGGETLSQAIMEELIQEIYDKGYAFTCPHGRPFVKKISLKEMASFFDRGRHILGDIET